MKAVLVAAAFAILARAACIAIPHDRILVSDIESAVPGLCAGGCESAVVGFAPAPGAQRALSIEDLVRFAHRNGGSMAPADVHRICVERATAPLRASAMEAAMRRLPELAGAEIEIVEFSRIRVPDGAIVFHLANLPRPPGDDFTVPVIWRGQYVYDERRTLPIWATVRILVNRPVIRAIARIDAGVEIAENMLQSTSIRQSPAVAGRAAASVSEVIGKKSSRRIEAGAPIELRALTEPDVITAGEKVQLTVESGGIRLTLDAEAVSGARLGQTVVVRNGSGRSLHATAEGKGVAVLKVRGEQKPS